MFPWPLSETDPVLDDALIIAMDYLRATGQADDYIRIERMAAATILTEWRKGVMHPLRLSNAAIVAVQNEEAAKQEALCVINASSGADRRASFFVVCFSQSSSNFRASLKAALDGRVGYVSSKSRRAWQLGHWRE